MIPLGVLAQRQAAAGGGAPAIVQYKTALTNTLTLDATPTPGNLLVIGAANGVTTPSTWTYSHDLTLDVEADRSGWVAALASGIVQSGDSATVTVTGMNASYYPRLVVWEVSDATALADSATATGGTTITSLSCGPITSGGIAFAVLGVSGNISGPSATDMTTDLENVRGAAFSAVAPTMPFSTTITWTNGRNAAAVLGGYA